MTKHNNTIFSREDFNVFLRRIDRSHNNRIYFVDFKAALFPISTTNKSISNSINYFTSSPSQVMNYKPNNQQVIQQNLPSLPEQQQLSYFKSPQSKPVETQSTFYENSRWMNQQIEQKTSLLDNFMRTDIPTFQYEYANEINNQISAKTTKNNWNESNSVIPPPDVPHSYHHNKDMFTKRSGSLSKRVTIQNEARNTQMSDHLYDDSNVFMGNGKNTFASKNFRSPENSYKNKDLPSSYVKGYASTVKKGNIVNSPHFYSTNRAENIKKNPLHFRHIDPLYNKYWNSGSHHDKTIANTNNYPNNEYILQEPNALRNTFSHFLTSYNKGKKISKNGQELDERLNFFRFKDNPFRFTDHEHYFKNYYGLLRNQYYDQYYNQKISKSQGINEEIIRQAEERQVEEKQEQLPVDAYPKFIPFKVLQQSVYDGNILSNKFRMTSRSTYEDTNFNSSSYNKTWTNQREHLQEKYNLRPEYKEWNTEEFENENLEDKSKQNRMNNGDVNSESSNKEESKNDNTNSI